MDRTIKVSEFKARCLALFDQVAETRTSYVVTKRGRPVARVVPLDEPSTSTDGSVTLLDPDEEAYYTTGERWAADEHA